MLARTLQPRGAAFDPFSLDSGGGAARPPLDWKETPAAHVFRLDLPGLRREDVAVEVEGGRLLRVRAEEAPAAADEAGGEGVRWHCRERVGGGEGARRFFVQFRLPEDAAADEAQAAMADGVLTVTVPKKKKGRGKKKKGKAVCCRLWP